VKSALDLWLERRADDWAQRGFGRVAPKYAQVVVLNREGKRNGLTFGWKFDHKHREAIRDEIDAIYLELADKHPLEVMADGEAWALADVAAAANLNPVTTNAVLMATRKHGIVRPVDSKGERWRRADLRPCTCGHVESAHEARRGGRAPQRCRATACECQNFEPVQTIKGVV
jgi:hypothetical protein